nr:MAG TPA: hypothetical protein [Caudoviricetes sp.]
MRTILHFCIPPSIFLFSVVLKAFHLNVLFALT